MDHQTFENALAPLTSVFKEILCLAFPTLGKQRAGRITEHLRGLNYTTFRRRLRDAAASFGVQIEQSDVEALTKTRNALVHRGAFFTEDEVAEFQRIQSVMDRLVMGLLGYTGPYIDARTFERAPVSTSDDPAVG